jgi:multiple sugar transport system substrate-binding protein
MSTDSRPPGRARGRILASFGVSALIVALAAGCGSSGGGKSATVTKDGFEQATQAGDAALTVWVDSTREAAAKLYQQQHPELKMDIFTYDGGANGSNYLQTKVQLFDRTGKGWPDVVFSAVTNDTTWGASDQFKFLAPLNKGLIPQDTLDKFAKGAMDVCTVDGTMYCLRNDLSQVVLWYNKKLLDQFGYQVPTTWEQYQQLGLKVAAEHPGYLVGDAGDAFTPEIYMWASKCPANQVTGAKSITVNTTDPHCTKMAALMDTLIKAKSMSATGVFSADYQKNKASKVLMMPGPAWYGGALFQGTFKTPKGEIAAAPALQWGDDPAPATGNVGGGTWLLSRHSTHLAAATAFLTWVTTSDDYQGKLNPGFPAYVPAATTWLAGQKAGGYYATDVTKPLQDAAPIVWSGWGSPQFSQESIWAATVIPGLTSGKTITSLLPDWQKSVEDHAKSNGYKVN